MRIGHGYDVHAFTGGDHLVLGGIKIPHNKAFKAHSDGDVLLHAVCDALLGALALGDIGQHFPDTAEEFAGIDSGILLQRVYALVTEQGYTLLNLDSTIIAQAPKLAAYIQSMRQQITAVLGCAADQVNVKATTTEKLGFAGRQEGVAAHAVVLLQRQSTGKNR
ncbi:MAG: 2-C-methyl-D-erythritol 2,4-cyclodiphosphate synthase [Thiothrix nivea]|nr:MAG: 2-C-methyl-D-erythritol 2,4-cyclodiphosphate synthase [Thiothrix nivea]